MVFMGNTQKSVANMLKRSRAIPACAGRTEVITRQELDMAGHPRMCGVNASCLASPM